MIGHVSTGASFFHCISYCMEDKQELSEEQKINKSLKDGLQHYHRAETLEYNKCFGDKHELTEQFKDVRKLSKRVEKPVLHLSVRFAPGEMLSQNQLIDIGREMAKDFGVADNQYITVLHKDTNEQHIHLVANRVGYNGKAASTSNNYLKMDRLCRRLEKHYQLQEVLSAKRFLPKELRHLPRHDSRKEKMKQDIQQTLQSAKHYYDFEQKMRALGYDIIKGRGITFIDEKKMKVKGSDLGFSLSTIEKFLQLKNKQQLQPKENLVQSQKTERSTTKKQEQLVKRLREQNDYPRLTPAQRMERQATNDQVPEKSLEGQLQKAASSLLHDLIKPEYVDGSINIELLKEARKKKKRRHLGL